MNRPKEQSPYRLIVEGGDDQWTIINVLAKHGYNWDDDSKVRPFIYPAGGVDNVLEEVSLRAALKTHERLGLVIDADFPSADRYSQAVDVLRKVGIDLPRIPPEEGVMVNSSGHVTEVLGLWLMPDNRRRGRLEEFLDELIPPGDVVKPHAKQATSTAIELGAPLRPVDAVKGELHAWLAWQRDPGLPLGAAIGRGLLRHDSPTARAFVSWFLKLFPARDDRASPPS